MRSTRSTRLCAYTCETQLLSTSFLLLLLPSNSYKQNLRGLDVTLYNSVNFCADGMIHMLMCILDCDKRHAVNNGFFYYRYITADYIDLYYVWLHAFSLGNNRLTCLRGQALNLNSQKKFCCTNNCGSCFTHRGSLTRHLRYELTH